MAYKLEHSHRVFIISNSNGTGEDACTLKVTIDKHSNGTTEERIDVEGLEQLVDDIKGGFDKKPKNISTWFNCLSNLHELLKEESK